MKVLLLADSLPNGGLERQLTLVGRYLPREWERRVWSLAGGAYVDVMRQAGIEVHVDDRRSDIDVSPAFRLWRLVRSWRPDVVHAWGWMSSTAVAPVCLTAGIPLVDGSIRRAQRTRSRFHPLNTGLHLARLVVANSYAGLRAYDIPPRRGRVVYNGFDPDRFRFSEASPKSDDRVAVVMTGRMVPQKDYATFFAAARYLVEADSRAWQFVAVGEGPGRRVADRREPGSGGRAGGELPSWRPGGDGRGQRLSCRRSHDESRASRGGMFKLDPRVHGVRLACRLQR